MICQKANLKIWQGFIKIIFTQSSLTWPFGTRLFKLGNYSIPKMIYFEVNAFKLLVDGRCVKKRNIIINKVSNEREEKFSLRVDWQDERRVVIVHVYWDKYLLIWA